MAIESITESFKEKIDKGVARFMHEILGDRGTKAEGYYAGSEYILDLLKIENRDKLRKIADYKDTRECENNFREGCIDGIEGIVKELFPEKVRYSVADVSYI